MDRGPSQPYKTAAIPLDGGLDFVSPPSMVQPGTLTRCLNYEVVDRNGYRRADGYGRWDGSFTFAEDREYQVTFGIASGSTGLGFLGATTNDVGKILYIVEGTNEIPVGIITYLFIDNTYTNSEYITFIPIVSKGFSVFSSFYKWQGLSNSIVSVGFPSVVQRHTRMPFAEGVGAHELCIADNLFLMPQQSSPLSTSILATHYFNDKAYLIKDAYRCSWAVTTGSFYPGDVLFNEDDQNAYILLNPTVDGGFLTSDVLWVDTLGNPLNNTYTYKRGTVDSGYVWYTARPGPGTLDQYSVVNPNNLSYSASHAILHETVAIDAGRPYKSTGVDRATITNVGSGYTSTPYASITGGDGFGARVVASTAGASTVQKLILTNVGSGYTSTPTLNITDGGGTGATGTATLRDYRSAGIRPINTGWKFPVVLGSSTSGFFTKLDRQRGPTAQVTSYSTANKTGVPFGVNTNPPTETQGVGIAAWQPSSGSISASLINATDANNILINLRDSFANDSFRTVGLGAENFSEIFNNVPSNSVITGLEIKVYWSTSAGFSVAPVRFDGVCNLYETKDGNAVRLGNTRTVPMAVTTGAASGTATFGSPTDLWGVDGFTIEDLDADFGAAFQVSLQKASGSTFDFNFVIDKIEAVVHYRSASITYYFASGTGSSKNVVSATLVSYNKEKGELEQNNWEGIFQVADLDVVSYANSDSVGWVNITNGGTGYTSAPTVDLVTNRTGVGVNATGTAVINNGVVVGVIITNGGTNHSGNFSVVFSGGGGSGAAATAVIGSTPGVMKGYGVYLDSSLNNRVGIVEDTMSYNGLDTYSALKTNESRYEIVSANFYADENWEGIYGVSGAGRAFYYDGRYFSRIYAIGLDAEDSETKDKPRHVCNYRYHLALGYRSGSVLFSKVGEPEVFDGLEGAGEVGIGDRITGIVPLPGQYLAVFCESSIWGITGKLVEEFSLENIVPNSGAIEYTIVQLGDKPIYCDNQGITTLEQSDKYGNFLGNRLSHKVSPWLLPRLRKSTKMLSNQVVAAYPVRKKNQYRVWFQDGMQLVMTMIGPEEEAQFTFTRFMFPHPQNLTTVVDHVVPLALSSNVDSKGEEHILFSIDRFKSRGVVQLETGDAPVYCLPNYLYRADYTNSFGVRYDSTFGLTQPVAIPAYFQTAFSTVENPFFNKTVRKARLEGTHRGLAQLALYTDKNYQTPSLVTDTPTDVSLAPYTAGTAFRASDDFYPASKMGNVAETDRVVTMLVSNHNSADAVTFDGVEETYYVTDGLTDGIQTVEPPFMSQPSHYAQLILVQYEEGKEDA